VVEENLQCHSLKIHLPVLFQSMVREHVVQVLQVQVLVD
jgi:hypothetical protein